MGLFNLFSGKSPADHEHKGDDYARNKKWGDAKLAYEVALEKLARQTPTNPRLESRLHEKLLGTKEALATGHDREAQALLEAGCLDEARELLNLALGLTTDKKTQAKLRRRIEQTEPPSVPEFHLQTEDLTPPPDVQITDSDEADLDDQFHILLGMLPEEIQRAYQSYGTDFKHGYLALNQGAFDQAVTYLNRAHHSNPESESLVPLELATTYVNLGRNDEAQSLLEDLVGHQPDLLPAFQMLSEIYWGQQAFDRALNLLDTLAPELAQSMGAYLLKGQTLLQASRNKEALSFFKDLRESHGWHEPIAIGLAHAHEALNQIDQARDIYGEMMAQCSGCGKRVDPALKRKFADLSLATGDQSTQILESYLALSREDPINAGHYYRCISRIYTAQGQEEEARRFQAIAEQTDRARQSTP